MLGGTSNFGRWHSCSWSATYLLLPSCCSPKYPLKCCFRGTGDPPATVRQMLHEGRIGENPLLLSIKILHENQPIMYIMSFLNTEVKCQLSILKHCCISKGCIKFQFSSDFNQNSLVYVTLQKVQGKTGNSKQRLALEIQLANLNAQILFLVLCFLFCNG